MRARNVLLALFLGAALVFAALRQVPASEPRPAHPFLAGPDPLVFAHRGGSGLWPENTLHAFRASAALGVDVLEMDVRRSADGRLVVFHDATLERTTDGSGPLAARPLAALRALDAGYRFTRDGGRTFPFRGRGLRIPALDEVFRALPRIRMNLEIKEREPEAGAALCTLVREHGAGDRVLVAAFRQAPIDAFRARCPEVATAATTTEAWRFWLASTLGLPNLSEPRAAALQLLERVGPLTMVTPRLVAHARTLNLPVHAWHVESSDAARRLLERGVAGIMTGRPDRLLDLLGRGVPAPR